MKMKAGLLAVYKSPKSHDQLICGIVPMKVVLVILIMIFASLNPIVIFAETHEVEVTGEYVMGDRDTKADARAIALEHAKLLAVERIGIYLESEQMVIDNQLTKNELRTYASAIVKTVVISEDLKLLQNKTTVLSLNIRANVDISMLEDKIREIKSDDARNQQISSLQLENIRLLIELDNLSSRLKSEQEGQYRKLLLERENVLASLDKNHKSIRIAFEKGTLLNLAMANRAESDKSKKYIDDALQFIADNARLTLIPPQIRNKGNKSDLVINAEWSIQRIDVLLDMLEMFHERPQRNVFSEIPISPNRFKGINRAALSEYFETRMVRLKVHAGPWIQSVDLIVHVDDINYIRTNKKEILTIRDIPTDRLDQITSMEGEFIVERIDSKAAVDK